MRESRSDQQSAATPGFVLAGGASSRMGRDKALVDFAGQPLIARVLATLRQAGLEPRIAGARSDLDAYAPVLPDAQPDRGPLSGVCTALSTVATERAVFVSVDLPMLPASLIAFMVRHAELTGAAATLVSVNGFPQTFPAVIRRSTLPVLQQELAAGPAGCFVAFGRAAAALSQSLSVLPVEALVQAGQVQHPGGLHPAFWFLNVNSPEELQRALALENRLV